eukprot:TRINITY_DN54404_c0_g1_i1.p1 TRINITY_DN54404_c0_g1~~TRINITY_DN54404_c0_g1_i1.p1  ORF type:complete len:569 (-),score=77.69 TRINITY_DN54404_c0_g1_i1:23-1729(-)
MARMHAMQAYEVEIFDDLDSLDTPSMFSEVVSGPASRRPNVLPTGQPLGQLSAARHGSHELLATLQGLQLTAEASRTPPARADLFRPANNNGAPPQPNTLPSSHPSPGIVGVGGPGGFSRLPAHQPSSAVTGLVGHGDEGLPVASGMGPGGARRLHAIDKLQRARDARLAASHSTAASVEGTPFRPDGAPAENVREKRQADIIQTTENTIRAISVVLEQYRKELHIEGSQAPEKVNERQHHRPEPAIAVPQTPTSNAENTVEAFMSPPPELHLHAPSDRSRQIISESQRLVEKSLRVLQLVESQRNQRNGEGSPPGERQEVAVRKPGNAANASTDLLEPTNLAEAFVATTYSEESHRISPIEPEVATFEAKYERRGTATISKEAARNGAREPVRKPPEAIIQPPAVSTAAPEATAVKLQPRAVNPTIPRVAANVPPARDDRFVELFLNPAVRSAQDTQSSAAAQTEQEKWEYLDSLAASLASQASGDSAAARLQRLCQVNAVHLADEEELRMAEIALLYERQAYLAKLRRIAQYCKANLGDSRNPLLHETLQVIYEEDEPFVLVPRSD